MRAEALDELLTVIDTTLKEASVPSAAETQVVADAVEMPLQPAAVVSRGIRRARAPIHKRRLQVMYSGNYLDTVI